MDKLPEMVEYTLQKMRRSLLSRPETLLETWGGGQSCVNVDYVFADFIGHDDELLEEFVPIEDARAVWYRPIHQRLSVTLPEPAGLIVPSFRTAEYHQLNGCSLAAVSAMHLPGWRHDPQSFLVRLLYVRYRRRLTI